MQLAEGFGNYIYIVFAVIYVIYSIIKASKKAQQKPSKPNQKPQASPTVQPPTASPLPKQKPEEDFKKMLEDLMGEVPEIKIPDKQIPKPKPQSATAKPAPAKIAPHHPKKEKLTAAEAKFVSAKTKTTSESTPFVSHPEILQQDFSNAVVEEESGMDFDIRQAIIYSEILKRPQY